MREAIVVSSVLLMFACAEPQASNESNEAPEVSTAPQDVEASEVRGEEITYEVDGVQLTGYLAYDANIATPRPGVLVVHEWWGHNDYVRKRADMLAEMGYAAFALDMYGDGKLAEHPEDAQKFMMEVLSKIDTAVARFDAAKSLLEEHAVTDPTRTAAIGYCFGGAVVLHMARIGADLDAVASFHGDLSTQSPAQSGMVTARILVAHGADDPFVPQETIEAFKQEMADAGVDMRFIAYPGAVHSFTNPAASEVGQKFEIPLAYNEDADRESWQALDSFLVEAFAK